VSLEFGDPAEATRLAKLVLEADPDSRDARKILADVERGAGGGEVEEIALEAPGESTPEIEIERSSLVEEAPKAKSAAAVRGKPAIAALGPNEEFDSLPDIEIVLEDEEDKDGKFASVEPPKEVRAAAPKAPAAKAALPPAPAEDEDFEIEVEI